MIIAPVLFICYFFPTALAVPREGRHLKRRAKEKRNSQQNTKTQTYLYETSFPIFPIFPYEKSGDISRQENTGAKDCIRNITQPIQQHHSTSCISNSECHGSCRLLGEFPDQFLGCDDYDIMTDFQKLCDEIVLSPIDDSSIPLPDFGYIITDHFNISRQEDIVINDCIEEITKPIRNHHSTNCTSNNECRGSCRLFGEFPDQFLGCDDYDILTDFQRVCDANLHSTTIVRDQDLLHTNETKEITDDTSSSCLSLSEINEVIATGELKTAGCISNDNCEGSCRMFESNGNKFLDCDDKNNFEKTYERLCNPGEERQRRLRYQPKIDNK